MTHFMRGERRGGKELKVGLQNEEQEVGQYKS